jgi:hypothetical protein
MEGVWSNNFYIDYSPHCRLVNNILLDVINYHITYGELYKLDDAMNFSDWKILGMDLK